MKADRLYLLNMLNDNMMKKRILISILAVLTAGLSAQFPDGNELLDKISKNMTSENRIFTSKMIIHGRRGDRTIESKSWSQGEEKSFTEYLSPAREAGTKMLKLGDQLWIYSPFTDRTIQIAGHMLRQSVMGSDMSYEDMMEDPVLSHHYTPVVTGEESIDGTPVWIMELTAFDEEVAYYKRKIWVDKKRYIPLREELYAKSGQLLKKTTLSDVKNLNGRWFPTKIVFKDMLSSGDGTEFIIEEIKFNQNIPDYIFSKASLRK
jgi:outer membrane lipoprotein-sorting protein